MIHPWSAYQDLKRRVASLFSNEQAAFFILTEEDEVFDWKQKKQAELTAKGLSSSWAKIGVVFDDPNIIILRDLVEFPGGYRNGYIRIYNRAYLENGAAGVAVLPVKGDKILLIQHYRHATRSWHWEIPRGFGQAGVNAETQAIHEIREEIEGEVETLLDLGILYNNTGLEGNPIHLFLAHLSSIGQMEAEEAIETYR